MTTNKEVAEWVLSLGPTVEDRINVLEDLLNNAKKDGMSPKDEILCETALSILQAMSVEAREAERRKKAKLEKLRIAYRLSLDRAKQAEEEPELPFEPVTKAPAPSHDQIDAAYAHSNPEVLT